EEAPGPQGTLSTAATSGRTTAAWTTGEARRAIAAVARMFGDYTHDDHNNPVVTCPHCDEGHVTLRVLATAAQVLMKRRRALDAEAEMKLAYYVDDGAVGHDAQGRGRQAGVVSAAEATTVVRCNRGCTFEFALWPVGMAVDGVAAKLGPGNEVLAAQAGTSAVVDWALAGAVGSGNVDDLRILGGMEEVTTATTAAVWGGSTASAGGGNVQIAAPVSDEHAGEGVSGLELTGPARWILANVAASAVVKALEATAAELSVDITGGCAMELWRGDLSVGGEFGKLMFVTETFVFAVAASTGTARSALLAPAVELRVWANDGVTLELSAGEVPAGSNGSNGGTASLELSVLSMAPVTERIVLSVQEDGAKANEATGGSAAIQPTLDGRDSGVESTGEGLRVDGDAVVNDTTAAAAASVQEDRYFWSRVVELYAPKAGGGDGEFECWLGAGVYTGKLRAEDVEG
ncbi:hypothetical protein HK405_012583, partial [Cladochytrium tenue]